MKKFILFALTGFFLFTSGCSSSNSIIDPENPEPEIENQTTDDFEGPEYADDYSSISAWSNKASWNLANVHDPSVVYDGEYYYMYGTDASYGNAHEGYGHFLYRRSKDLVDWEFRGMAMTETPLWVKDTLNSMRVRAGLDIIDSPIYGHWAPVVRKVEDKYRMYYSIVVDNYIESGKPNTTENFDGSWTEHAFIGLMESDDLSNNAWVDKGMIVSSVSDRGNNWSRSSTSDWNAYFKWNAIDPTFIITPEGNHWLIYGSWHSGIVALQVNPNTGKPDNLTSIEDYGSLIARRQNSEINRWQAQEGPEIIYNEKTGFYYLFLAYDELSAAYNTRVCRSTSIIGPYLGIDGTNITEGGDCWPMLTHPYKFNNHSGWMGISHCAVFKNEETNEWFYSSQARLPANTNGNAYSNAIMMGQIRKICWTEDGWPVVMPERYAGVPQPTINESDLTGTWENISMNYEYQVQQKSTQLILTSNMTASGALSGTWSYDQDKKILTIGEQQLNLEKGWDWEISPRITTFTYSGLTSGGKPIWGKKTAK